MIRPETLYCLNLTAAKISRFFEKNKLLLLKVFFHARSPVDGLLATSRKRVIREAQAAPNFFLTF